MPGSPFLRGSYYLQYRETDDTNSGSSGSFAHALALILGFAF
jgi:hypothetical protein